MSPMDSMSRVAMPERSMVMPMKMNRGTAVSVKLVITPQMRRGRRLKKSSPNPASPKAQGRAQQGEGHGEAQEQQSRGADEEPTGQCVVHG